MFRLLLIKVSFFHQIKVIFSEYHFETLKWQKIDQNGTFILVKFRFCIIFRRFYKKCYHLHYIIFYKICPQLCFQN